MRVLVVGGGGREHTLVWKIKQSPLVEKVYCAPGNPGIASLATCVDIDVEDLAGLLSFAQREKVDLTVVGPEVPLVKGIADVFAQEGLMVFGPEAAAAELEGSKVFAKDLMQQIGVPTAEYKTFSDVPTALAYIEGKDYPLVIKAEGLAAGKGVIIASDEAEAKAAIHQIMVDKDFGAAGGRVVVEEFLQGEEASLLAFSDGERVLPMLSSQDHKAVFDGDTGPNTGGMGAYAPAPVLTTELLQEAEEKVLRPVIGELSRRGITYRGILYAGLMLTKQGIKVLEFNVRFGDPETQAVVPLLKSDIVPVMLAVARGSLEGVELEWHPGSCACVVMASGGYPGAYEKGAPISGLDSAEEVEDVMVFHAGTAAKDGRVVTAGGRVLGVTALDIDLKAALKRVYSAVEKITFPGCQYRKDIGLKGLSVKKD